MVFTINHMQTLNIIHRDLKPNNIMFDDDMNVKIIDFGEAKDITESLGPENYKTDEEASKTMAYDRGDQTPEIAELPGNSIDVEKKVN